MLQNEASDLRELFHCLQEGLGLAEAVPGDDDRPADLRYIEVNPAFLRLTGLPADTPLPFSFRQVFPAIGEDNLASCLRAAFDGGRTWFDYQSPAGGAWLRVQATSPSRGRLATLLIDITEHRRNEELFYRLVREAPIPVLVYEENGRILVTSRTVNLLTGYREEELHTIDDWLRLAYGTIPGQVEEVRRDLQAALEQGRQLVPAERTVITRCGQKRVWFFSGVAPGRLGDGRRYIAVTAVDITEHREGAEELRRNEERFRTLALLAPVGIFLAGRLGDCQYVNQHWCKLTGLSAEQALGLGWLRAVYPDDLQQVSTAWQDLIGSRGCWDLEFRFRHLDGTIAWVKGTATPLHDPGGEISGYIGITVEITERRETELTLRRLNEKLEQQVARRNALAERRARQLQALTIQLIEAEERERNRIAAILHDDLQQLLAAARRKLHWLTQTPPDNADVESLSALLEEAIYKSRRLSHELSPPVLHYSGLASALEWLARQMQEQHGLEVHLEVASLQDEADETVKVFLFHALQELLLNVINHAKTREVHVTARTSRGRLQLIVRDEGRGFDPRTLEPADGRLNGVGLFRIRERVHTLGGSLKIVSAEGRGACFTLTVPHRPSVPIHTGTPGSPRKTGHSSTRQGGPNSTPQYRVLFVDDHRVVRQGLISMLIGQPGIRVVGEASDGAEAVEMARALRPDVVVMDVAMPKLDGIKATRRIRQELPEVRVIGLSMIEDREVIEAMHRAGAERCVSKTASSAVILQAIYGITEPA